MFTLLNKTSPSESSTGAVYSTFRQRNGWIHFPL